MTWSNFGKGDLLVGFPESVWVRTKHAEKARAGLYGQSEILKAVWDVRCFKLSISLKTSLDSLYFLVDSNFCESCQVQSYHHRHCWWISTILKQFLRCSPPFDSSIWCTSPKTRFGSFCMMHHWKLVCWFGYRSLSFANDVTDRFSLLLGREMGSFVFEMVVVWGTY